MHRSCPQARGVILSTELHCSAGAASINGWARSRSRTLVYRIAFFFARYGLDADRAALLGALLWGYPHG